MTQFLDSAENGNVGDVLKHGIVNGALWAIGVAWATGIREIALIILPTDSFSKVIGELVAMLIVTIISTFVAVIVAYNWSNVRRSFITRPSTAENRGVRPTQGRVT